jgi:hypothetical protein
MKQTEAPVRAHSTNNFNKERAITVPETTIVIRIEVFRGILSENSV